MRTRLYRDGVEVWHSDPAPLAAETTKTEGYFAEGSLEVPKGLNAGRYLVRVDVVDKDAPDTANVWQWAKLTLR